MVREEAKPLFRDAGLRGHHVAQAKRWRPHHLVNDGCRCFPRQEAEALEPPPSDWANGEQAGTSGKQ